MSNLLDYVWLIFLLIVIVAIVIAFFKIRKDIKQIRKQRKNLENFSNEIAKMSIDDITEEYLISLGKYFDEEYLYCDVFFEEIGKSIKNHNFELAKDLVVFFKKHKIGN